MLRTSGQGLVLDFSPGRYTACPAGIVADFPLTPAKLRSSGKFKDLGHMLADEFLECRIGQIGLRYDSEGEVYRDQNGEIFSVNYEIRTTISKLGDAKRI